MKVEFEALIFDCDGTLVLTADLHFAAIGAALAAQGAVLKRGWYEARTGLGRRDLMAALGQDLGMALDVDRAEAESIALTLTSAADVARENPPVVALARRYHGRMPMAVATNAEAPVVRAVLDGVGLRGLFDPVVSLTEAGRAKPDPAMFLMAAAAMGMPPARCLVLEDSAQGLTAAAAAGCPALDVRRAADLAILARL